MKTRITQITPAIPIAYFSSLELTVLNSMGVSYARDLNQTLHFFITENARQKDLFTVENWEIRDQTGFTAVSIKEFVTTFMGGAEYMRVAKANFFEHLGLTQTEFIEKLFQSILLKPACTLTEIVLRTSLITKESPRCGGSITRITREKIQRGSTEELLKSMRDAKPDVAISVVYDTDLSRIYFEDAALTQFGKDCYFYSPEGTELESPVKSFTNKCTKQSLSDFLQYHLEQPYEVSEYTFQELKDECANISLRQWLESDDYAPRWIQDSDAIALMPEVTLAFRYITILGYSQGDSAVIMYPKDEKLSKEWLTHLFYDSPITIRVEITDDTGNSAEFNDSELLDDAYEYDEASVRLKLEGKLNRLDWLTQEERIDILDQLPSTPEVV